MEFLVGAWLLGIVLLVGGFALFRSHLFSGDGTEFIVGGIFFIGGLVLLGMVTFGGAPIEMPSGLPETSINAGEYKVAFVYPAGENVNLGIERKEGKNERLYLYQFPRSAFDGNSVNPQAKKLLVVEGNGFRRMILE